MTLSDNIRRDTNTARILTTILHSRLHPTLHALDLAADNLDGYPTTASGALRQYVQSTDSETTSVERAVLNRIEHDPAGRWNRNPIAALDEGADLARTLLAVLHLLTDWCDTHSSSRLTAPELDLLRCTNWRRDDPHSCGNFATPRRHNNQTIDDRRCLGCGQLHDELEDQRRIDSNRRRLDRHHASGQSTQHNGV